jgi:hypothetical protein
MELPDPSRIRTVRPGAPAVAAREISLHESSPGTTSGNPATPPSAVSGAAAR